jgi:hypothetical protein
MTGSVSPLALSFLAVILLAILGAVVALVRSRATFAGYRDIEPDARQVARALKGEIFRDASDVVVSGNHGGLPTIVRFSRAENTPGLNLRMEAPATFSLSVVPRGEQAGDGRIPLRTGDEAFDVRYTVRVSDPTQGRMFLGGKPAMAALQKLCTSGATFLNISSGSVEYSELAFPAIPAARRITAIISAMGELAASLKLMPGAHLIAIQPIRRGSSLGARLAIAAGVLAALAGLLFVGQNLQANPELPKITGEPRPEGVNAVDAPHIANLRGWRLASDADFDGNACGWLRSTGARVSGRIPADFGGGRDVAYILADLNGGRRVVLLIGGENRYDSQFPYLALATRIPRSSFAATQWLGRQTPQPDGDGLLLVRAPNEPASGLVLYTEGRRIMSAVPLDYQTISLAE